ncbi:hypothetical protein GTE61_004766 [Salmonella enterica subsp. enterica]|nr:hypothetical protein [Salmonella enterica subsp. enterica]
MAMNCLGCHPYHDGLFYQIIDQLFDTPLWIMIPFIIGLVVIFYGFATFLPKVVGFLVFLFQSKRNGKES